MSTQFNVQAMVGATESEYLGSEVVGSLVEVRGGMEGGGEFMECAKFGHVGGIGHEFNPPPAVFPMEFFFEVFCVVGGYCVSVMWNPARRSGQGSLFRTTTQ